MKLPNPEKAFIDNKKLAGYSLNPEHDEGKHKARVFKSALNLTLDHLKELKVRGLIQIIGRLEIIFPPS